MLLRYCEYCGRKFQTKNPGQFYCDHECDALAKWAKADERYAP